MKAFYFFRRDHFLERRKGWMEEGTGGRKTENHKFVGYRTSKGK
jgi:hypothetical protein